MPTMSSAWHIARESRRLPRARQAFERWIALRTGDVGRALRIIEERERAIEALPLVEFKGRPLRQVVCVACGQPRNYWPSHLWSVVDLTQVVCPWCLLKG
ncbi:MAG TPA: hypothetical protein PLE19_12895 [Planctomycetota bacterium]|nr:hypothetical protein [Planctomycetota bacterium]HRR82615.1 hypothetical protein [Planctomycetota bacterium]HRT94791.1 hypothetical protein [Planctomycetota bacterium]